ncbi:uncharacterized protein DMAD_02310 [Drosophila madeirensis]|uniref:Uncharacterized protein n=1 Tax=Drosophila madeirensis TaxID=30013 RepID=A0AAU9G378_DROMD
MNRDEAKGRKAVGQKTDMHQAISALVEQAKRLNILTVKETGSEASGTDSSECLNIFSSKEWKRNKKYQAKMLRQFRASNTDTDSAPDTPVASAAAAAGASASTIPQMLQNALTVTSNMVESQKASEMLVNQLIEDSLSLYDDQITDSHKNRNLLLLQQLEIETNDRFLDQMLHGLELKYKCENVLRSDLPSIPKPTAAKTASLSDALIVAAIGTVFSSQNATNCWEELVQSMKAIPRFRQIMTEYNARLKEQQGPPHPETQLSRCQRNIKFYQMMIVAEAELMRQLSVKVEATPEAGKTHKN